MSFTKSELAKLRSELPPNASRKLAEKFGMQPGSVRNILSGLSQNDIVIIAAVELARVHQESLSSTKALLASI